MVFVRFFWWGKAQILGLPRHPWLHAYYFLSEKYQQTLQNKKINHTEPQYFLCLKTSKSAS